MTQRNRWLLTAAAAVLALVLGPIVARTGATETVLLAAVAAIIVYQSAGRMGGGNSR